MTESNVRPPEVLTEFTGHPQESGWVRAYIDACDYVRQERAVRISDVADLGTDVDAHDVALLVHVLRAAEANFTAVRQGISNDCDRQNNEGRLALGISPYGPTIDDNVVDTLVTAFGNASSGAFRWITPSATIEELRELIAEWLLLVVDRRFPRLQPGAYETETVLAEMSPAASDSPVQTSFWSIP